MQPPVLGIEQALLGFLWQRPMHAYEAHQQVVRTEALWRVWPLKQSYLYVLLAKLEEGGYLASTTEPRGTRPPRRVFHLTPAGKAAYTRWVTQPVEDGPNFRVELLTKLFFASQDGSKTVSVLLEQQRCACQGWLDQLHREAERAPAESPYEKVVYQFRLSQIQAILCWLETHAQVLVAPASRGEREVHRG